MASQRITIAKIGGAAGLAVLSRFRDWAETRTIDDPCEWTPDQWPAPARREMDAFASSLRSNGHRPPVVYFSEHVDLWSMGDLFGRWFPEDRDRELIHLHSDRFELWCYPLPDGGKLADLLRRSARLKRIRERNPQEDRWFVANLREATLAWEGIVDAAALVLLREVFGGLTTDEEIEESLSAIPGWIARIAAFAP